MADYARGELLRELRTARHESQLAVALAIGTTDKSVRAWEHGGTIKWENAKKLARHYRVDPETLVSRDESAPDGEQPVSQLDRIESKLDAILSAMGIEPPAGPSSEGMAEALEAGGREVQRAIEAPPLPKPGRSGSRRAAVPRKSA